MWNLRLELYRIYSPMNECNKTAALVALLIKKANNLTFCPLGLCSIRYLFKMTTPVLDIFGTIARTIVCGCCEHSM